MPRPLIGISTRRLPATALGAVPPGVADAPIEGVFSDYAESVAAAGGIPVLLPRSADVGGLVDRLDGIVLAGGEDVEPHRYGADPVPQSTVHDAGRDEFEMALVRGAIDQGLPILAICRGVQLLNSNAAQSAALLSDEEMLALVHNLKPFSNSAAAW